MKEIRKKIREALRRQPEIFNNRQVLKNILKDALVDKPLQINLLMTAYDANIGLALRENDVLDMSIYIRWTKRLAESFGLNEHSAGWAIINWFMIYNKQVLSEVKEKWKADNAESNVASKPVPKPPTKNSSPYPIIGENPVPTEQPAVRQPPKQPANKPKKFSSGNGDKLHLLETVYRANFPNTPKWMFFRNNYDEADILRHHEITRDMKEIALRLVCHNRYKENEIIHLRISSELSHGWALTHDSICIGGTIGNFIIRYIDFESMKFGSSQNLIPVKDMELKIGSPYENNFSYARETVFINGGDTNSDIIIQETSGRKNSIPYVSQYSESSIIANVFTPLDNFLKAARNICAGGNLSAKNKSSKPPSNNNVIDIGFLDKDFWY